MGIYQRIVVLITLLFPPPCLWRNNLETQSHHICSRDTLPVYFRSLLHLSDAGRVLKNAQIQTRTARSGFNLDFDRL